MEYDAFTIFQQNALKLKTRESTCYGLHIDPHTSVVVSCTDFGHIHLYHHDTSVNHTSDTSDSSDASDTNKVPFKKKTLSLENPPIFATQLGSYSNGKVLFCGGRNNVIGGYLWDKTLMTSPHNSVISTDLEFNCASDEGTITCITCVTKHDLVYAANDRGKIFCFNVVTGQSVMGHSSDSHSSSVHSLKFVSGSNILVSCDSSGVLCTWDARFPGKLLGRSSVCSGVAENLGISTSSLWVGAMDVDVEGNFVYLGGGGESSKDTSNKTNNVFHRASTGWLASFFLSDFDVNDEESDATTLVKCVSLPVPLQTLHLHENELVTGGAQPLLSYWRCHSLEHMSSMQTSAQSIFAIASHDQGSEEDGKTMLLAAGGTLPVVDLISVIGHKEAVLWPL